MSPQDDWYLKVGFLFGEWSMLSIARISLLDRLWLSECSCKPWKDKSSETLANNSRPPRSLHLSWSFVEPVKAILQKKIQEFTCQIYFRNTKIVGVSTRRYQMFCARKGDIESGQLPSGQDTLLQHTLRANYQADIWRRSLESFPDTPQPSSGHGREVNDEGDKTVSWMTGLPAPNDVLSLISCTCTRSCRQSDCLWLEVHWCVQTAKLLKIGTRKLCFRPRLQWFWQWLWLNLIMNITLFPCCRRFIIYCTLIYKI